MQMRQPGVRNRLQVDEESEFLVILLSQVIGRRVHFI